MIRRTVANPEVTAIAAYLEPRGSHALMPTAWYGDDFASLPDPYDRCNVYKLRHGFKGTAQRLGRGSLALCMTGYSLPLPIRVSSDEESGFRIAKLYLPKSHEELYYVPVQETLASVAAEGVYCYINGYSEVESADLKERNDRNMASWKPTPEDIASWMRLLDSLPPQR